MLPCEFVCVCLRVFMCVFVCVVVLIRHTYRAVPNVPMHTQK